MTMLSPFSLQVEKTTEKEVCRGICRSICIGGAKNLKDERVTRRKQKQVAGIGRVSRMGGRRNPRKAVDRIELWILRFLNTRPTLTDPEYPAVFDAPHSSGLGFGRVSPMPRPESNRDFSDPVVFGQKGSVLVGFSLSSRFTRYISGRTVCIVLGQSEISNIWWIEMGSAPIKLIQLSAFPISKETPLGRTEMGNYSIEA